MATVHELMSTKEEEEFIAIHPRAIIFFGSQTCSHCRRMLPIFSEFAAQYPDIAFAHVEITRVEVENINEIPVFVGYRDQVPVDIVIGASPDSVTDMITTKLQ